MMGLLFAIVAAPIVGLLGGVLLWNLSRRRAADARGDI